MSAAKKKKSPNRAGNENTTARNESFFVCHPYLSKFWVAQAALLILALIFDGMGMGGLISGVLLCLVLLGLYYIAVFSPLIRKERRDPFWLQVKKNRWYLLGLFVLFTMLSYYLISQEKFIYYWDYSGYWARSVMAEQRMFQDPLGMLSQMLESINTAEYNYVLPVLMALPLRLFGTGYVTFIVLICVMFVFPAALMLSFAASAFSIRCRLEPLPLVSSLLATLGVSCLLIPCLQGFYDAGGLLCIASLLLLVAGWDWGHFSLGDNHLVVVLLLLVLIQRRYYGFFVVGFVVAWGVQALLQWLASSEQRHSIAKNYLVSMLHIGGVSLLLLLALLEGFLKMSLFGDYAIKYSAYAGGGFSKELPRVLGFYGWGIVLIILIGFIFTALLLCRTRHYDGFAPLGMLLTLPFVSLVVFLRVQAMGPQHQYVVAGPVLILLVLGLTAIRQFLSRKAVRMAALGAAALFLAFNFASSMSLIKLHTPVDPLFSQLRYSPKIRNDIPVLQQLDRRLSDLTEKGKTTAYILASSEILNNDIFYKLYFPKARSIRIPGHAHVDLRDGFAPTFFDAKYVVVCDPVQYHLKPDDQQVIGLLANDILQQTGIGPHYTFLEEYTLDRGVKAKIYVRETPLTESVIIDLAGRYNQLYPDYPELFYDRIMAAA